MTDTQWPIYLVFQQLKPDLPHVHAGAVHAPDAELAMLHARDVFVRRPACYSIWVVPAADVLSRTKEQLERYEAPDQQGGMSDARSFVIFQKLSHSGVSTNVGEVRAHSLETALFRAVSELANKKALVWWVVPEDLIVRSQPDDGTSMFEPANRKAFRHQSDFKTLTLLRELRSGHSDE